MNRYDGNTKYLTKDCEGCPHLAEGQTAYEELAKALPLRRWPVHVQLGTATMHIKGDRGIERHPLKLCLWGVAIKILFPREKPRACEYRNRVSPRV